jgi:hypothetical protein
MAVQGREVHKELDALEGTSISIPFKVVTIGRSRRLVLDDRGLDAETLHNLSKVLFVPNALPPDIITAVDHKTYAEFASLLRQVPGVPLGELYRNIGFASVIRRRMDQASPTFLSHFVNALLGRNETRTFAQTTATASRMTCCGASVGSPSATCNCYECKELV